MQFAKREWFVGVAQARRVENMQIPVERQFKRLYFVQEPKIQDNTLTSIVGKE